MDIRRSALLACAAFLAAPTTPVRAGPPAGAELREASVAVGYDPKGRCSGLIQTDVQEPSAALVVLVVGPSGVPSQPSIKASSGSDSLDAAAVSCVMKLRFLPAVRAGEGSAMASWQQIAWKWGREHFAQTPPAASPAAAGAAPAAATATLGVAAGTAAPAPAAAPQAAAGSAEVRVCADDTGKLTREPLITRSSGNPRLDEAALRIARSGATSLTGCAQLAIKFETR
ncbi:MAG TPA: energy transducer TonB [Steroidobacteraceae bacterium]|nr:energy transducer TonB [Steroidobacteraceae bacterium]